MASTFDSKASQRSRPQENIAIVGMACIFPGAPNLQRYWQNIVSKVDATGDPPEEWGAEFFYDPDAQSNDRTYCKQGGYLKGLAEFNPLKYGVMPNAVPGAEPGHFLALRVAYESLADAGYFDKPIDSTRVEVILGKGAYLGPSDVNLFQHAVVIDQTLRLLKQLHPEHTEQELAELKRELKAGLTPFSAETVPGWVSSIMTGRINNRLDFMGTNYTIDAACASSLIAVEHGIHDLLAGRCDMALVGGIEPCMPPVGLMVFCQISALSREGRIRPFDKNASGTLLGEGVGIVALKRQEDAERHGDRIYALIKGVGVSSDGRGAGLLAPRLEGEALALRRAYEDAAVSPETVGLIEAHGTGVPLGDVTEIKALSSIFGARKGLQPVCAVGSVKSMISHLIHAAGIAGLIKTALAIHHQVLPPTLNCEDVNPELELEKTPFYVNTETRPWIHGGDHPRRAGVSAFGFGGINAHIVLEEAAGSVAQGTGLLHEWETEVVVITGESRGDLIESCQKVLTFLFAHPKTALKDLAYTLNCPLQESKYRIALVAESLADLQKKLEQGIAKLTDPACTAIKDRRGIFFVEQPLACEGGVGFMFPGYGSQYTNMLSDLCIHFPEVRACFDNLDKTFLRSNRDLLPSQVFFPPPLEKRSADSAQDQFLSQINLASSAIFAADLALFELITRLGIRPDAIVGHSNGEFTALLASGAIVIDSEAQMLEYGLRIQSMHDSLADQIPTTKVLAIGGGDPEILRSLMQKTNGSLQLTIDNCPHQVVLCGSQDDITNAYGYLSERGVICTLMPFDHAVHSPLFQKICEQSADFYDCLNIVSPKIPVYSCTTAQQHSRDPGQIRELLVNHLARPVRFRETIEAMYDHGVRIFVEIGPKGNLTGFVNDILGDRPYIAIPSNVLSRSGVTQLNHMVGLLAAHHVLVRPDHLYERRCPTRLSLESTPEQTQPASTDAHSLRLALEYRFLKLENGRGKILDRSCPTDQAAPHPDDKPNDQLPANVLERESLSQTIAQPYEVAPLTPASGRRSFDSGIELPASSAVSSSRSHVMAEYLQTMERFLETQEAVVEAFLARGASHPRSNTETVAERQLASAFEPHESLAQGPFNLIVQSMTTGLEVAAKCRIDLREHLFLRDHTLGRSPSVLDQTAAPMSIVPLTFTMEIMAQVASLLMPGKLLIGMKNLRAHRWIEVDGGGCVISLNARVKSGMPGGEVEVAIEGIENALGHKQTQIAEGTMVFGDQYPGAPAVDVLTCRSERRYSLPPEQLYNAMFHGPCFRCVDRIDQLDQDGIQATLSTPRNSRLFRSHNNSDLLTDPILLDGAGQVIGFWTLDRFEDGSTIFPIGFEALQVYRPFSQMRETIKCQARISCFADGRIRSDIDLVGSGGELLVRLLSWEDMRSFGWTHSFTRFILSPRDVVYSTPWARPVSRFPASLGLQCFSVSDGPGGIWPQVLAGIILTGREREVWREMRKPERSRRAWLLGRLAAKDSLRRFIQEHHHMNLCPADIGIVTDDDGRLHLAQEIRDRIGCDLAISISYSEGKAAAVVGLLESGSSIGIAIEHSGRARQDSAKTTLSANEHELLVTVPMHRQHEWTLRLLCAKTAVANGMGSVRARAVNCTIADLKLETGEAIVCVNEGLSESVRPSGKLIPVHTGYHEELIFAVVLI